MAHISGAPNQIDKKFFIPVIKCRDYIKYMLVLLQHIWGQIFAVNTNGKFWEHYSKFDIFLENVSMGSITNFWVATPNSSL